MRPHAGPPEPWYVGALFGRLPSSAPPFPFPTPASAQSRDHLAKKGADAYVARANSMCVCESPPYLTMR